ncbi:MAG: endo-1,4-beta-xylanase [Planctomycetota bacterium]
MRCIALLFVLTLSLNLLSAAAAGAEPPAGGTSLLPEDPLEAAELRAPADLAQAKLVPVSDQPFDRAVRVRVTRAGESAWDAQLAVPLTGPVRKGNAYLLRAWVRGRSERDEAGDALCSFKLQKNERPWDQVTRLSTTAGREWRRLDWPFRADISLPRDRCILMVHLAQQPQVLEIGGLHLTDYGPNTELSELPQYKATYRGRKPDAPWRREAAERIERIRKGELTVRVAEAGGRPVPNARVEVRMKRHAFGFGAALKARLLCRDTPDARRYRRMVERLYNKVVLENDLKPFAWDNPEAKANRHPRYRREWIFRALRWLQERDIEVRGHYVTWAPLRGRFQQFADDPAGLKRALFERIADIVPKVGNLVDEWDAVNHIIGWGNTYADVTGSPQIYVDIIERARELAPPGVELWVNEGQILPGGGRRDHYERVIRYLLEHGAPLDGVGFMGHFSTGSLTPPAKLYDVLERYAQVAPTMQLTEFDVNVRDEQLQADYLRDVMTVAFSHPKVEAVVMWGFWEKAFWRPQAALYRADWTRKPSGRAWEELVFERWWTEQDLTTGPDGRAGVRGFLGDYEVTVRHDGRVRKARAVLTRDGTTLAVELPGPGAD